MSEFSWDMTDRSIVKRADAPAAPETFEGAEFKKAKLGGGLNFEVHVVAESMDEGPLMKRARVSTTLPPWGHWDIICDEGKMGGGLDSAPAPLMYLSVGTAFCLMTHINILAMVDNVKIENVKIEQKTKFNSAFEGDGEHTKEESVGTAEFVETHVILDSPEPPEKLEQFVEKCRLACMAGQTVARATPSPAFMHLNGQQIELS